MRAPRRSKTNSVVVKISASGKNVICVPVCFLFFSSLRTVSFCVVLPLANDIK